MITMLNGEWQINSSEIRNLRGRVPGSLLTSLLDNDLIGEPSYRDNAENIREKYLYENYTFSRKFSLSEEQLKKHNYLFAEGIDTVASIFINGVKIADVCDMFMRYRIKVDNSVLSTEKRTRSVRFCRIAFESEIPSMISVSAGLWTRCVPIGFRTK